MTCTCPIGANASCRTFRDCVRAPYGPGGLFEVDAAGRLAGPALRPHSRHQLAFSPAWLLLTAACAAALARVDFVSMIEKHAKLRLHSSKAKVRPQ
jgi:hypothetical protein